MVGTFLIIWVIGLIGLIIGQAIGFGFSPKNPSGLVTSGKAHLSQLIIGAAILFPISDALTHSTTNRIVLYVVILIIGIALKIAIENIGHKTTPLTSVKKGNFYGQ